MPPPTSQPEWFALRLRSRFEFTVEAALAELGFEPFLPVRKDVTRWSDRTKTIIRPLFTGYIFGRFDRRDPRQTARVLQCRGVVAILGKNESIPDHEIATLRRVATNATAENCPYEPGSSRVRVVRGPFAGVTGVVTRVKGATTLTIPVEILGRAVSVQIDAADVAAEDKE